MRNIGLPVELPKSECTDQFCPFHSTLSVRGRILEGIVVRDSMKRSVIIQRDYYHYISKYQRYERRHSRIATHNPPCIDAKNGDLVKIMECRPLSKSVSFVIIEKMSKK
jgi:small subunit ribosomal protein S17